jgi:hypothetical protein
MSALQGNVNNGHLDNKTEDPSLIKKVPILPAFYDLSVNKCSGNTDIPASATITSTLIVENFP